MAILLLYNEEKRDSSYQVPSSPTALPPELAVQQDFQPHSSKCSGKALAFDEGRLSNNAGNSPGDSVTLRSKKKLVKKKFLRTNLIFWSCYFLYEWLANAAYDNQYLMHLKSAALYTPLIFAATMFTVFVLIKQYFLRSLKKEFWVGLVLSMLVFGLMKRGINYFIIYPPEWQVTQAFLFPPKIIFEIVSIYLIVALYAMFYFTRAWYEQQELTQALQKDKVESQLELLKSQVQPHFIFNTLNNIYSLAKHNSPQTPDLIYRLSSLLSYMLYDSKQPTIPLTHELEYISNYIELEKIRYGDRLDISMNVLTDPANINIAPFLLLPLVENSFKHGANSAIDTCWIRIDVLVNDNWLIIKVENSKSSNGHQPSGTRSGIGLENVKKRLEYIYPKQHELKCINEEQTFLATMKIGGVVPEVAQHGTVSDEKNNKESSPGSAVQRKGIARGNFWGPAK